MQLCWVQDRVLCEHGAPAHLRGEHTVHGDSTVQIGKHSDTYVLHTSVSLNYISSMVKHLSSNNYRWIGYISEGEGDNICYCQM